MSRSFVTPKLALAALALLVIAPLMASAASQAGPQLEVTPATGFYSSGPQGGPFNSNGQVYSVKNTGSAPMTFTSSVDQPWVSILLTNNTINPGETWGDPISINSQANSLTPGTYTSTVTFTNATTAAGNTTRTVTLFVGSAGDTTPPSVTITSPAPPTASTSSSRITISGTASDNVAVTSMYWVNMQTNESATMPGGASWSFTADLVSGDNQVYVLAWDAAGNQATASIVIHYGASAAGQMDVSPATDFIATGPSGGPFNPSSQVYTVTNQGTSSMSFTATATQSWVSVFAGAATLGPGQSWGVVVSFTGAANSLASGTYAYTVTFTNTTNGSANTTRTVTLVVGSSSDTTPPSMTIVSPAPPTATASSSPVTISGTASDNVGVASISWFNMQTNQAGTVPGSASWSVSVPLIDGSNSITITAWDAGGNGTSASITVTLTGSPAPLGGSGSGGHHKRRCLGAVAASPGERLPLLGLGVLLLGWGLARRRPR